MLDRTGGEAGDDVADVEAEGGSLDAGTGAPRLRPGLGPIHRLGIFRIDLSGIVFREMNTGVLKSFLYFEDGCEFLFTVPSVCSVRRRVARPMLALRGRPIRTFSVGAFAAALQGHRHCRLRTRRPRILALTVFWTRFRSGRLAGRLGPLVA